MPNETCMPTGVGLVGLSTSELSVGHSLVSENVEHLDRIVAPISATLSVSAHNCGLQPCTPSLIYPAPYLSASILIYASSVSVVELAGRVVTDVAMPPGSVSLSNTVTWNRSGCRDMAYAADMPYAPRQIANSAIHDARTDAPVRQHRLAQIDSPAPTTQTFILFVGCAMVFSTVRSFLGIRCHCQQSWPSRRHLMRRSTELVSRDRRRHVECYSVRILLPPGDPSRPFFVAVLLIYP